MNDDDDVPVKSEYNQRVIDIQHILKNDQNEQIIRIIKKCAIKWMINDEEIVNNKVIVII